MRRTHQIRALVSILLVSSILGSALLFPSPATASTLTTIQLWIGNAYMSVNGVQKLIDAQGTKPIISAGRTLVPIRAVIEAFGGSVAWEASTSKVTVTLEDNSLELWINRPQASLNGVLLAIDAAIPTVVPVIMNGRTMIPLRFVGESLGIDVQYDDATKRITLQGPFAPWTISTLDSTGVVGSHTAIAVDANEKVHISYIDSTNGKLKYKTNVSGSWVTWIIGSASDQATSIAADANGKCHIVYNGTNGDLSYATNVTSDAGLISIVEAGAWSGVYGDEDIAIDSGGNPHMTYFRATAADLKYATKASGAWSTSIVVDGTTPGPMPAYSASIGVDSDNKIHICYYDDAAPDSIKYVTNASGSWVETTIDAIGLAAGWRTSLAVDSNNKIHMSYYVWNNDALKYATNASGTWQTETVDNTSGNVSTASLAIDKTNQVHVVYSSGSGFMYARKSAGTWHVSRIDESWTGNYNSIAIGPNSIHVSYQDGFNSDLKYAWKPLF